MIKRGLISTAALIAVFSIACEKQNENLPERPRGVETTLNKPLVKNTSGRETGNQGDRDGLDSFLVRKDRIFYPIIKPEFDPGPLNPESDPWSDTHDKK